MLPYFNISVNDAPCLWDRKRLMDHMGYANNSTNIKRLERLTKEREYFPPIIRPKAIRDSQGRPVQQNLLDLSLSGIKSKRGKFLIIQFWGGDSLEPMICSHDGRGTRNWMFLEKHQNLGQSLQIFINLLSVNFKNPILCLLHGELASIHAQVRNKRNVRVCETIYREQYKVRIPIKFTGHVPNNPPSHLDHLEAESIHIIREVQAETKKPVMLYSVGKDSAVMLHLARKAFWPGNLPFPLLHVDTGWKFRAMYEFKEQISKSFDLDLITYSSPNGLKQGINPFDHGPALHTEIMKTQALKQALKIHKFDAAFGGARRDEEKSRSKERIFSFRTETHEWDPRNQRPELWNLYNSSIREGESIRVFPLSNWTELDIWTYINQEKIPLVPLYYSANRPVIEHNDNLILVDDDRFPLTKNDQVQMRSVRFRTLGCYPLTGAIESEASSVEEIILELFNTRTSERQGRTIDKDEGASMEQKKKEGYF